MNPFRITWYELMSPFNYKTTESELREEEFVWEGGSQWPAVLKWESPVWMTTSILTFFISMWALKSMLKQPCSCKMSVGITLLDTCCPVQLNMKSLFVVTLNLRWPIVEAMGLPVWEYTAHFKQNSRSLSTCTLWLKHRFIQIHCHCHFALRHFLLFSM